MQLTVENPGKALIHLNKAKTHATEKYLQMQGCARCSEDTKRMWNDAVTFFDGLIRQVEEQTNGR